MSDATKFELWMLVAICAVLLGWNLDRKDVTAEIVKEVDERKADVKPEDRIALMHPLGGCTQFIQKCDSVKCRVYPVCADRSDK